jgi:hypothetical protein
VSVVRRKLWIREAGRCSSSFRDRVGRWRRQTLRLSCLTSSQSGGRAVRWGVQSGVAGPSGTRGGQCRPFVCGSVLRSRNRKASDRESLVDFLLNAKSEESRYVPRNFVVNNDRSFDQFSDIWTPIRNGHVHCLSLELPRRFDPLVPCVLFLS